MTSREELIEMIEDLDNSIIGYLEATIDILKRTKNTKSEMLKKLKESDNEKT